MISDSHSIFPEPYRVADSVSSQPYRDRIIFTKSALVVHASVLLIVGGTATIVQPWLALSVSLTLHIVFVIALTLVRKILKTGRAEAVLSMTIALANSCVATASLASFRLSGFPVWAIAIAGAAMLSYLALCGRDFSFLGFIVAPGVALAVIELVLVATGIAPQAGPIAWLVVLVILSYTSYDLAMIMKRRKTCELISSVADFQRDIINLITYPVRILNHWRKYKFTILH